MRTLTSVLALAAFVALQATGAEEVPVQSKEIISKTEARQATSTSIERNAPQSTPVAVEIQNDLRGDPLFETAQVNVDLYKGLVIVHGSAANRDLINAVNDKLREREGVVAVYNYMKHPEMTEGEDLGAISVSYDAFRRLEDVGASNNSFTLAQRVSERLLADSQLAEFDFDVDAYMGAIVLHGNVSDDRLAKRARDIAAHTPGVQDVLNYVNMTPSVSAIMSLRPTVALDVSYTQAPRAPVEIMPETPALAPEVPVNVSVERYDHLQCEGCCH